MSNLLSNLSSESSKFRIKSKVGEILDNSGLSLTGEDIVTVKDLYGKLKDRLFHQPEHPYIDKNGNLCYTNNIEYWNWNYAVGSTVISEDLVQKMDDTIRKYDSGEILVPGVQQNKKDSMEINLYSSSRFNIDFLSQSISVDMIDSSKDYTNTVNLKGFIKKATGSIKNSTASIDVKYTINGSERTTKTYTIDNLFLVKTKENSNSITILYNNITNGKIDDNVNLEFIDGIVRVIPINPEVTECIISKCIVNYGGTE